MKRLAMSLAALFLLACGTAAALEPREQLAFADGLYARGLWDVALKEYQAYLAAGPSGTNAMLDAVHYRMGECWRELGKMVDAESAYARAYLDFPGGEYHFRAGLRRAELMEQSGQVAEQIQLLETMIQERPAAEIGAACRYALGSALAKAGKKEEAARSYESVLHDYPGTSLVGYAALALAALRQGAGADESAMEPLYLAAVSNASSARVGAEAWFQLGDYYFRSRRYEQSARAYESLARSYPGDERVPQSRLQLAWAYFHAKLYADALRTCEQFLGAAEAGRRPEWLYLKANCERQLGRNAEAAATYASLLEKHPQADMADYAAYERSLALYKMGDYSNAVREARALVPTARIRKDVLWLLGESSAAIGDDAGAIQYYRLLAAEFPASDFAADALYRLGHLMQRQGELIQAAEIFSQVSANYPRHELAPQALFASASCYGRARQNEAAVAAWARLIEKYPESRFLEESLYQKGMVEVFLRRDGQARESLAGLLRRFPSTRFLADAHFWMGVLQEESGQLEDAEQSFRKSLAAKPAEELLGKCRYRLGLVLQRRGRVEEAAAMFQELIATPVKAQFTPGLLEWLAEYHLDRKSFALTEEAAEALMERADTDEWRQIAWLLKGKAALGQGRMMMARQFFESVVASGAKSVSAAEAHVRLGDIRLAGGEAAEARAEYEKAAGLAAADTMLALRVQAYAGIGKALKAQGDMAGAARYFLSVAVLFDDPVMVPECLDEAADAFAGAGRTEESGKVIRELLERFPESSWAKKRKQVQ